MPSEREIFRRDLAALLRRSMQHACESNDPRLDLFAKAACAAYWVLEAKICGGRRFRDLDDFESDFNAAFAAAAEANGLRVAPEDDAHFFWRAAARDEVVRVLDIEYLD